jgi:hypothetical protein
MYTNSITSAFIPNYTLLYYLMSNFGTPTQIRTERTTPFERVDFTNLSIGAMVGWIGIEPILNEL